MSKEAMDEHDEEERIALGSAVEPVVPEVTTQGQTTALVAAAPVVSNWRYFLHGRDALRGRSDIEMNVRTQGQEGRIQDGTVPATAPQHQPTTSVWARLRMGGQ
jgi:hypothetical protein